MANEKRYNRTHTHLLIQVQEFTQKEKTLDLKRDKFFLSNKFTVHNIKETPELESKNIGMI